MVATTGCTKELTVSVDSHETLSHISFGSPDEIIQLLRDNELNEFQKAISRIAPASFSSYEDYFESIEDELAYRSTKGDLPSNLELLANEYPLEVISSEDGYEFLPLVKSLLLRRITNKNRIVQFGDEVYQYEADRVVISSVNDISDYADLRASGKYREENYLDDSFSKSSRRLEGILDDNYRRSGDDHRLKARWYSRDKVKIGKVDFSEVFIEIKHQRRGFLRAWFAHNQDEITAVGDMYCYVDANEQSRFHLVNHTRTNASQLTYWVQEEPRSYPLDQNKPSDDNWVRTRSSIRHFTRDDGFIRGDCTISK